MAIPRTIPSSARDVSLQFSATLATGATLVIPFGSPVDGAIMGMSCSTASAETPVVSLANGAVAVTGCNLVPLTANVTASPVATGNATVSRDNPAVGARCALTLDNSAGLAAATISVRVDFRSAQ